MKNYDIIVVGGGHAGCEAALAAARMGLRVIMLAMHLDSIAMMPCNPSIGGTSKGHLVREIDALGGEMGKNIDKAFIQSRMLNKGKGPAVHSLRAQADKHRYVQSMRQVLENEKNLHLRQAEVVELVLLNGRVAGVKTQSGAVYEAQAVVLTVGTYLQARCLYGETVEYSGPNGLQAANRLSDHLKSLGIRLYRFKTGTPARIDKRSVDFSKMEVQHGDAELVPFSFESDHMQMTREQIPCYLTYTNNKTHDIIKNNLHRSPLYAGVIEGIGTRYCPSIEDKIVRFADKERHQVFIEPEGEDTNELYVQGMSTSLPEDVQEQMYRTIPGLENCRIVRNAYAIEYDCIDATQLTLSLACKQIQGLYCAGQLNGSSGYEEAAAQGLMAGINAALSIQGKEPLILDRSQAYIGVLIDDLVTKGTKEPYRMMTSRAEYRLLLRQDNADLRLTELGFSLGLISKQRYEGYLAKKEAVEAEIKRVKKTNIAPSEVLDQLLSAQGSAAITTGVTLDELIKRPELDYFLLSAVDTARPALAAAVQEQVNIQIKYEGYIKRQQEQVLQFKKMEQKRLPADFDYTQIQGLRLEARQKLNSIRPQSIGHAARITGVSPADITVLMIYFYR